MVVSSPFQVDEVQSSPRLSWPVVKPIHSISIERYVSPLARAVLTHGPGETVEMIGGEAVILDVL